MGSTRYRVQAEVVIVILGSIGSNRILKKMKKLSENKKQSIHLLPQKVKE